MKKFMLCCAALALLAGCKAYDAGFASVNNYYAGELETQKKNVQGANDNALSTWSDIGCAIPYGTLTRSAANVTRAVVELCGAPTGVTITWTQPQLVGAVTGQSAATGLIAIPTVAPGQISGR